MEITIKHQLTPEGYKEYLKLHFFKRNKFTLFIFLFIPFTGIYLFYSKLKEYSFTEFLLDDSFYFSMGIVLMLFPFIYYRLLMRSMNKQFRETGLGNEHLFIFSPTHFNVTTGNGNSYTTPWKNIHETVETEQLFLIYLDADTAHVLEKKQLSAAQIGALHTLLEGVKISAGK